MVAPVSRNNGPCIYCGAATKRGGDGEHIIQKAIGGARTLNEGPNKLVCQNCNSGIFGNLDRELCSRSYLSVMASERLSADLWQAWDVDHASRDLLVEARPKWVNGQMHQLVCFPQMTFELKGPDVRGDLEEIQRFGYENFESVIFKAIHHCYRRYCAGEHSINFERVRSGMIQGGYRYPPRIYTPHTIGEIAKNMYRQSFVLRFVTEEDKRFALRSMSKLGDHKRFTRWGQSRSSYFPTIAVFFDMGDTLRALLKMGVNLVAEVCDKTVVTPRSFRHVIRVILGDLPVTQELMASNGFVQAQTIQPIKCDDGSHSFRLMYVDGFWCLFSSFFGGKVGAFVRFPGPCSEDWSTADIVAPIRSKNWTVTKHRILLPLERRIEWNDSRKITPSFELHNTTTSIHAELGPRRKRRKPKGAQ